MQRIELNHPETECGQNKEQSPKLRKVLFQDQYMPMNNISRAMAYFYTGSSSIPSHKHINNATSSYRIEFSLKRSNVKELIQASLAIKKYGKCLIN